MLKVEEKVTFIWQNIHPEKFDPYSPQYVFHINVRQSKTEHIVSPVFQFSCKILFSMLNIISLHLMFISKGYILFSMVPRVRIS